MYSANTASHDMKKVVESSFLQVCQNDLYRNEAAMPTNHCV